MLGGNLGIAPYACKYLLEDKKFEFKKKLGFVLGGAFLAFVLAPVPDGMNPAAMKAAAVSILMAIFGSQKLYLFLRRRFYTCCRISSFRGLKLKTNSG